MYIFNTCSFLTSSKPQFFYVGVIHYFKNSFWYLSNITSVLTISYSTEENHIMIVASNRTSMKQPSPADQCHLKLLHVEIEMLYMFL